jgi:ATP-dependent 26S proteasome regulatory subunit
MDECAWHPFDLGEEGVVLFGPPGTDGSIVRAVGTHVEAPQPKHIVSMTYQ